MASSKGIPTNEQDTLAYIDESASQADGQRLSGLRDTQNTQFIKDEILQREKKRLEAKHGSSHPAAQEAESRIAYNQQLYAGFNSEIEKASIKTEPVSPTAWRVHGRVLDSENKAVTGATVFLSDRAKGWIEILGSACTTDAGYYALTADEQLIDKMMQQPVLLTVSDKDKKVLYLSDEALFLTRATLLYKDIYLKEGICVPPPAPNGGNEDVPKNTWVVKGRVTDENGRPLPGLTIGLYDKELVFEASLGKLATDADGNFEGTYLPEAFKELFEKKPEIFIQVLNSKGKKVYNSETGVRPEPGKVAEFAIKIDSGKKTG